MKHTIIFGAPFSGKGTQSKKITENFDFKHISTGDLLREEIKNKTELGLEAENYSKQGLLSPDELVGRILQSHMQKHDPTQKFLFDGYPRTAPQSKTLLDILKNQNQEVSLVLHLKVPEEIIGERSKKRMKEENRSDDKEDIIKTRLEVFQNETLPAIEELKALGVNIVEIDGTGTEEEIFERIKQNLS